MATPRVFISSTCYDLKYIRENLRYFVKTLGYDPVLSEDGNVFYSPFRHTHESCLSEIPTTQLFVLIIGGRYGGEYINSENSITNTEYKEAIKLKIPVFALVESSVYSEHHLFQKNRKNNEIDLTKLKFPSVDSLRIFEFIDEVRGNSINNAIVPFRDFGDIEAYLRQQWAGMMYDFLSRSGEDRRVADTLDTLSEMNARIEMLSKQILASVGTDEAKIDAKLYEELMASESIRDLAYWKLRPTPSHVFVNETFTACARSMGGDFKVDAGSGRSIGQNGSISFYKFKDATEDYKKVRGNILAILKESGVSLPSYLANHPAVEKRDDNGEEDAIIFEAKAKMRERKERNAPDF